MLGVVVVVALLLLEGVLRKRGKSPFVVISPDRRARTAALREHGPVLRVPQPLAEQLLHGGLALHYWRGLHAASAPVLLSWRRARHTSAAAGGGALARCAGSRFAGAWRKVDGRAKRFTCRRFQSLLEAPLLVGLGPLGCGLAVHRNLFYALHWFGEAES